MMDNEGRLVMAEFISGANMMASLVVATFFLHFFLKLRDRFFLFFSIAFALFAIERILLLGLGLQSEGVSYVFLCRLIGFVIIIFAIYDKNRESRAASAD